MPCRIAGIDVHKKMLAVVVADVEGEGDFHVERHKVGTSPADLRALAGWLVERQVDEVVMGSTAQYWATRLGSAGTALATAAPDPRRGEPPVGDAPPRPSAVESRARRPQEGFSRRRTSGKAPVRHARSACSPIVELIDERPVDWAARSRSPRPQPAKMHFHFRTAAHARRLARMVSASTSFANRRQSSAARVYSM
jgi:hypothetical protein